MTEPLDPQSSRARILELEQECDRLEREVLYWKNGTRILELEERLREAELKAASSVPFRKFIEGSSDE